MKINTWSLILQTKIKSYYKKRYSDGWSGIKNKIEAVSSGKFDSDFDSDFDSKFNSDDDFPLKIPINFIPWL